MTTKTSRKNVATTIWALLAIITAALIIAGLLFVPNANAQKVSVREVFSTEGLPPCGPGGTMGLVTIHAGGKNCRCNNFTSCAKEKIDSFLKEVKFKYVDKFENSVAVFANVVRSYDTELGAVALVAVGEDVHGRLWSNFPPVLTGKKITLNDGSFLNEKIIELLTGK